MPQQPLHSETQTEIHNLQALVAKAEIELEQLDEIRTQVKNRIRNCKIYPLQLLKIFCRFLFFWKKVSIQLSFVIGIAQKKKRRGGVASKLSVCPKLPAVS